MKKRNQQEKNELRRGLGTGSSVSLSAVGLLLMFFIPWMVYQQGAGWIAIGSFVGLLVLWSTDSYRLMRFSLQQEKHVTLPGFFSNRYQERYPILRIFFTVILSSLLISPTRIVMPMATVAENCIVYIFEETRMTRMINGANR